jgi:hypothetical protein
MLGQTWYFRVAWYLRNQRFENAAADVLRSHALLE